MNSKRPSRLGIRGPRHRTEPCTAERPSAGHGPESNAGLPGPDYCKVLENHGVAHVYNHWSYMPPLREQHQRMEERFTAPVTVLRLLTPLKMSYEAANRCAEPYTKIVEELTKMRRDTVDLVKKRWESNERRISWSITAAKEMPCGRFKLYGMRDMSQISEVCLFHLCLSCKHQLNLNNQSQTATIGNTHESNTSPCGDGAQRTSLVTGVGSNTKR